MNKHRKETMNSVHFEKLGENRYLIRVSEFYPDNCCEEDETIVTEEHLDWLLTFKDDDIREQDQDDDNRAIGIYLGDDDYSGTIGLLTKTFTNDVETELWLEQVLADLGSLAIRRAKMALLQGYKNREIAREENINHEVINRAMKIIRRRVEDLLKNDC